jgi:hypothetical protein
MNYSEKIASAYISNGLASEILLAAMNDPSIKVPGFDKDIPKMIDQHSTELKVSH